ncbi:MAG: SIS domain-containing protein [Saprospiraceae bacterium]|nr:SIS domain-containing protein [Saprospiraceae bacterium]
MDIKRIIQESISVKQKVLNNNNLLLEIENVTQVIINVFHNHGKVFFCGNGGSAADAQHLAAEFSGRFYFDRDPLFSEALHVNTSYLTAVANDYGFEHIYSRLIQAKGQHGDVLIGLSTSGNSQNIVNAFEQAQKQGLITIALTGEYGGKMKEFSDYLLPIPSSDTPRIQETHIMIGHIICELVEKSLFTRKI